MYNPLPTNLKLNKSIIHGVGLFAKEDIPKNTVLGISHVSHDWFDNGWIRTPLGGFYNHSEKPNCKIIDKDLDTGFNTPVKILQTIKEIKVDEELTCTYTIWKMEESKVIKESDWLGL